MGKCCNCNIEVLDESRRCPLCQSVLIGSEELENMYPDARPMMRRLLLVSRIYLFCAVVAEAVLLSVSLATHVELYWGVIPGLVMLYGYTVLRYAILGRAGHRSKIFILALIAMLSSVGIDLAMGYRGWSLDYVLPAGILLLDTIIVVCMAYNRRNWQSYIMWQLLMLLCSLLPAAFYVTGLERNGPLAFMPLAVSAALFLGTVFIGDRRARVELARRFHIR